MVMLLIFCTGRMMKILLIVSFLVAIFANMQSEVLIGWFGPLLTIAPVLAIFGSKMNRPGRFGLAVYGASIVTGIVLMEGFGMSNGDSARLGGWVMPPAFSVCFGLLLILRHTLLVVVLPKALLSTLDQTSARIAGGLGGAVLGTVVGALVGAVGYYFHDISLIFDVVFPENADEVFITTSTIFGVVIGAYLGATPSSSENSTGLKT
jgi:hypothetical protein